MKNKMTEKENLLILNGTENDGYIYKYYFNKTEKFMLWFLDFMKELRFKEEDYKYEFEEGIKERNQIVRTFRNDDFDVEVICFEDEIAFIVRTEKREELIELTDKYMKFKEELK